MLALTVRSMTTLKRMSTTMLTSAWSAPMATTMASTSSAVWMTAPVTAAMRSGMRRAERRLAVSPAASLTCGIEEAWRHPYSRNRRWSPNSAFLVATVLLTDAPSLLPQLWSRVPVWIAEWLETRRVEECTEPVAAGDVVVVQAGYDGGHDVALRRGVVV